MDIIASSIWQEEDSQPRETDESVNADGSFKSHMHHCREGKEENYSSLKANFKRQLLKIYRSFIAGTF